VTGCEPGCVDSPPTSICERLPLPFVSRVRCFVCCEKFTAIENESGVTFNTPMINPWRETSKTRLPIFQILSRITSQTNTGTLYSKSAPS
jgi:hypothetical protein